MLLQPMMAEGVPWMTVETAVVQSKTMALDWTNEFEHLEIRIKSKFHTLYFIISISVHFFNNILSNSIIK